MAATGGLGGAAATMEAGALRTTLKVTDAAISAYFTAEMAKGTIENAGAVMDAIDRKDWDEAAKLAGHGTLQALFATAGGMHLLERAKGVVAKGEVAPEPEPVPAPASIPSTDIPTVPETPATISTQLDQLAQGARKVVMLPEGTPTQPSPPGMATYLYKGNRYVYDPKLISGENLREAVNTGRITDILGPTDGGLGVPDKSQLTSPPQSVVSRDAQGNEVQSSLADEASVPVAMEQAGKITPEGGQVTVEDPAIVIGERQAGGPPPEPIQPPAGELSMASPSEFDFNHGVETPPAPTESSVVLGSGLGALQGPARAVAQDLTTAAKSLHEELFKPAIQSTLHTIAESADEIQHIFAPQTRGLDAAATALNMRENMAKQARAEDRAFHTFKDARHILGKLPRDAGRQFVDDIESGRAQTDPRLQSIADSSRKTLDDIRQQIQDLGTGKLEEFYDTYYPRILKQANGADVPNGAFYASRPLEGRKGFLRQRTFPTLADALAAGYEERFPNPIDTLLAHVHQAEKYLMAHRVLNEAKETGMAKYVPAGTQPPEGWRKVPDNLFTVYGPREGAVGLPQAAKDAGVAQTDVKVPGRRIMGEYYFPAPAADLISNHLSQGLRKYALFRGYLASANILNQFQLGWSAFHLGFTSIDAATSGMATGMYMASHGDIKEGAKHIAKSPIELAGVPIGLVAKGLEKLGVKGAVDKAKPYSALLRGDELHKAWMQEGNPLSEIAKLADSLVSAGGRATQDKFYQTRTIEKMMDAWRRGTFGSRTKAALMSPIALTEAASRPIMEYIVPRQKLGIFADMARYKLSRLPLDASPSMVRETLGKTWDSVDNRMGQLAYDNLFLNKIAKDAAMATIRTVGWNVGSVREFSGGIADATKTIKGAVDKARGKSNVSPELSERTAYIASTVVMTGLIGSMITYLMTGKPPQSKVDAYFPRTGNLDEHGNPERMSLPSYVKDYYHILVDPKRTVLNKLHPALNTAAEIMTNRDFYGTEIWSPGDPLYKNAGDVAKHLGKSLEPFASRGFRREDELGGGLSKKLLPLIGITPGPTSLNKTDTERRIEGLVRARSGQDTHTSAQADRTKARAQVRRAFRTGQNVEGIVQDLSAKGLIHPNDIPKLRKEAALTPLQLNFSKLMLTEMPGVYTHATDQEKMVLAPIIAKRIANDAGKSWLMTPEAESKLQELGFNTRVAVKAPRLNSDGTVRKARSRTGNGMPAPPVY